MISAAVATFRARWLARWFDTATVDRVTDRGALNATTKQYDNPTVAPIVTAAPVAGGPGGNCLIRPGGPERRSNYGDADSQHDPIVFHFNYDVPEIRPDDIVTVTATTWDTQLVGAVLRVREVKTDSYNTHRVVLAERDNTP